MNTLLRSVVASLVIVGIILLGLGAPAQASGKSTTSTILIGVAAAAAILTAVNVSNKNRQANTVVGYLSNGDRVYQDGHVVRRSNGQTYYPGDQGQTLSCNGRVCTVVGTNGQYRGHRYAYTHHHHG